MMVYLYTTSGDHPKKYLKNLGITRKEIEIKTLKQLVSLIKAIDCEVMLAVGEIKDKLTNKTEDSISLEIYDDYKE